MKSCREKLAAWALAQGNSESEVKGVLYFAEHDGKQNSRSGGVLNMQEAQKYLKASRTSIWRWIKAGKLQCRKLGGGSRTVFRQADLDSFIDANGNSIN